MRRILLLALAPLLAIGSTARAQYARVFVAAKSGNDANACNNVATPCQTFAGAVSQAHAGGEVIVLESGGYGGVTIAHAVTIGAPAGVTAFIHPASGNAITINAGASDVVTLRGLTLNGGGANGIEADSVGTLNVESCIITGFFGDGIYMGSPGRLNVTGTDIRSCNFGIHLANGAGLVKAAVDHCHLDGNFTGYEAATTSPGGSTTTATSSTANGSIAVGWTCGDSGSTGKDVLNLESCTGSENGGAGLYGNSGNAQTTAIYSNCVFANNGDSGVFCNTTFQTRGNSTITGNAGGATGGSGTIAPFSGM